MNRHGRPTNEHKSDSVRVRLSDGMRTFLEEKSRTTGKSISDIIRGYITRDMYGKDASNGNK